LRNTQENLTVGPGRNVGRTGKKEQDTRKNGSKDIKNGNNAMTRKYSAKKDYQKLLKATIRKDTDKFGQQIDLYWKKRDFDRLVKEGIIKEDVKLKHIKRLLDEIK